MPEGTYLFTTSVELSDSTNTNVYRPAPKMMGAGPAATIILNRVAGNIFTHTQTSAQGTAGSFSRGLEFSGFSVICDGSSPANARGIGLSGAYFPVFNDVIFYGLNGNAIETLNSNVFSNSDPFSCGTITLNRVVAAACKGWGVLGTAFSTEYELHNCYLTSNYGGFLNIGTGNWLPQGNSIAGNSISGNTGATVAVTSVAWATGLATVTTTAPHGYSTGDAVLMNGATGTGYCGCHSITKTGASTFTYPLYADPGSTAGTITVMQLSGGVIFGYQGGLQSMNSEIGQCEIQTNSPIQVWLMGQNNVVDHVRVSDDNSLITTAGSFVVGSTYTITVHGTTDFTLIGSANNTVGTTFVASGVGSGTGTASSFYSNKQIRIGGCTGSLSDGNKVTSPLFRMTSSAGSPVVSLIQVDLAATDGTQTARYNVMSDYHTATTGSPVLTPMEIVNPTNSYAAGNYAYTQLLPKGSTKTQYTTYDISTASGTLAVTGIGFKPTSVEIKGFVVSTAIAAWGSVDTVLGNTGMYYYPTGSVYASSSPDCLTFRPGSGDYAIGSVTSFDADGFTITWTKTGSPTGTATIQYQCNN